MVARLQSGSMRINLTASSRQNVECTLTSYLANTAQFCLSSLFHTRDGTFKKRTLWTLMNAWIRSQSHKITMIDLWDHITSGNRKSGYIAPPCNGHWQTSKFFSSSRQDSRPVTITKLHVPLKKCNLVRFLVSTATTINFSSIVGNTLGHVKCDFTAAHGQISHTFKHGNTVAIRKPDKPNDTTTVTFPYSSWCSLLYYRISNEIVWNSLYTSITWKKS